MMANRPFQNVASSNKYLGMAVTNKNLMRKLQTDYV
jgi:hypothetical protein